MKHTLRKYLSSRGSALFMVLSTMTALLIVVMAMYFSVVSSRSVQYAVFNQEQSYQSSISVADAVIAGLNDGKLNTLSGEFFKLKVGETKSTNGNGFASLSASGTEEDDPEIGAYDVTVTRLNDEGEFYVYDFVVTAKVNGVTETTHTLVRLSAATPAPPPAGRTFTATGYLPNENWIGTGDYGDEVHLDAEYCVIGLGESSVPAIFSNLTAAGSVEVNDLENASGTGFYQYENNRLWAIGGNLILDKDVSSNNNLLNMKGNSDEHGIIIVGGDLYVGKDGMASLAIANNTDMYVLGNVHLGSFGTTDQANLFVGGSIICPEDISNLHRNGGSNIYLTDTTGYTSSAYREWGSFESTDKPLRYSKEEIIDKLNTAIGSNSYPKWIPDGDQAKENAVNIAFNSSHIDISGVAANTRVFESEQLKYSDTHKSCIIGNIYDVADKNVTDQVPGEDGSNTRTVNGEYYIIIDTGDDTENIFTVRLLANRNEVVPVEGAPEHTLDVNRTEKYDTDTLGSENETFSWKPYGADMDDSSKVFVLVKGRGTVVFDIPEGVTYQASSYDFVGHMNWYAGILAQNGGNIPSFLDKYEQVTPLIHTNCNNNPCDYTDTHEGKKVEGGFWCNTHECFVESDAVNLEEFKNTFKNGKCACYQRVGRKEIDKMNPENWVSKTGMNINSAGKTYTMVDFDDEGEFIYPTTNVWLVSCDENAEIRLGETVDGTVIDRDSFFGFIYAPYMTYSCKAPAGDGVRLAGGLIVSDWILNDKANYMYIAPEKNYSELIGETNPLLPQGNRSWRKYGY